MVAVLSGEPYRKVIPQKSLYVRFVLIIFKSEKVATREEPKCSPRVTFFATTGVGGGFNSRRWLPLLSQGT